MKLRKNLAGKALNLSLGDGKLTAVLECLFTRPATEFLTWQGTDELSPQGLGESTVEIGVRYFVCNLERNLVIIDTGIGHNIGALSPSQVGFSLPDYLSILGASPEDVNTVIFTHLHMDHCGGALDAAQTPLFQNARHVVHQAEIDYWQEEGSSSGSTARNVLRSLKRGGLLHAVAPAQQQLSTDIAVVHTPGHTPGHMCVEILDAQGSPEVLVLGDILHHPTQFRDPRYGIQADVESSVAAATRANMLHDLVTRDVTAAAGHLFDNPFFTVEQLSSGEGFRRKPLRVQA